MTFHSEQDRPISPNLNSWWETQRICTQLVRDVLRRRAKRKYDRVTLKKGKKAGHAKQERVSKLEGARKRASCGKNYLEGDSCLLKSTLSRKNLHKNALILHILFDITDNIFLKYTS